MAEVAPFPGPRVSLETVYEAFKRRFVGAAEEAFTSLGGFQKELVQHLGEITELNSEIARKNAEFAMKMYDFERDICCIRDYYDVIISSTKAVVDYGSNQKAIPLIRALIAEKRYAEAKEEIKGFLHYLKKRIKRVEDDIDMLRQNCPDLDSVKMKILQENAFIDGGTKQKEDEVSESQYKLFKLGASTFFYTVAGAVTSMVVVSQAPVESGSEVTTAFMSAGTEALSFYTGSIMGGLSSVMEASMLSVELKNKIAKSVTAVHKCLMGFFKQVTQFQKDIHTIETCINQLDIDIVDLQEDIDSDASYSQAETAWVSRSETLQKMFADFARLSTRVIEVQKGIDDDDGFKDIIKTLERSVELVSLGTPV